MTDIEGGGADLAARPLERWQVIPVPLDEEAPSAVLEMRPDLIVLQSRAPWLTEQWAGVCALSPDVPWVLVSATRPEGADGALEVVHPSAVDDAWLDRISRWAGQLKAQVERAQHAADHDQTTGLDARRVFIERARLKLSLGGRATLVLVDLDRFRAVNDALGLEAGDRILFEVGARIARAVEPSSLLGRMAADEFAVLVDGDGTRTAERIRRALESPFGIAQPVTASIGVVEAPRHARDIEALFALASLAVRRTKANGGDAIAHVGSADADAQKRSHDLDVGLRAALMNDELRLFYQPQLSLFTGRIAGFEALLRWQRKGGGLTPPAEFVPALESSGLIVDYGAWVLREACRTMRGWHDEGRGKARIAVNVSPVQLRRGNFVSVVESALADSALDPRCLELEITEGLLVDASHADTRAQLDHLRQRGVRVAIDDFGTGYASLAYLRQLPLDLLKIDRAFVTDIASDAKAHEVVRAVVELARGLGVETLAEGVETAEQASALIRAGAHLAQGYRFARPMAAHEAAIWWSCQLAPTRISLPPAPFPSFRVA